MFFVEKEKKKKPFSIPSKCGKKKNIISFGIGSKPLVKTQLNMIPMNIKEVDASSSCPVISLSV